MLPRQESNIFPQNRKDAILSNNFTLFITVFGIIKAWIGAAAFLPFSLVFHFDECKVKCDLSNGETTHVGHKSLSSKYKTTRHYGVKEKDPEDNQSKTKYKVPAT